MNDNDDATAVIMAEVLDKYDTIGIELHRILDQAFKETHKTITSASTINGQTDFSTIQLWLGVLLSILLNELAAVHASGSQKEDDSAFEEASDYIAEVFKKESSKYRAIIKGSIHG